MNNHEPVVALCFVQSLTNVLRQEQTERDKLQSSVESTKYRESALKRRIEGLETSQSLERGEDVTVGALRAKLATLDAEKTSLSATMISNGQRDKQMIYEQAMKIKELDALRQTLSDNSGHMRITEQALTRKLVKIEATYEEMLADIKDFKQKDGTRKEIAENFIKQKIDFMEKSVNQLEQDKIRLLRDVKSVSLEREKLSNTRSALEDKLRRYETDQKHGMRSGERGAQETLDRVIALNARKELVEQRTHDLELLNEQYLEQIRDMEAEKETLRIEIGRLRSENEEARKSQGGSEQSSRESDDPVSRLVVKDDVETKEADRRLLQHQLSEAERQEGRVQLWNVWNWKWTLAMLAGMLQNCFDQRSRWWRKGNSSWKKICFSTKMFYQATR